LVGTEWLEKVSWRGALNDSRNSSMGEVITKSDMKVMEPRLDLKAAAIQPIDRRGCQEPIPRANEIKPLDLMDRRYLTEMESSGIFQPSLE
jgi:hypothetical protein